MKKVIVCLFTLFYLNSHLIAEDSSNPFSKITITSNKAVCEKDKNNAENYLITYKDDVLVKLADESNLRAGSLAITLKSSPVDEKVGKNLKAKNSKIKKVEKVIDKNGKQDKKNDNMMGMFKKIEILENIHIQQKNRFLTAGKIEVFPDRKICELSGDVKIEQKKENPKDVPITAECSNATLDMNTEEICLFGTPQKPVTTVIIIEGYPSLMKKKKTPQEKRADRLALKLAKKTQAQEIKSKKHE
ncbi:TPA: hypothetical protein DEO28_04295 [Candidatus Dependentiae bacterium]|nr:MAG: hypothetical protein UR14_C0006G0096 [candidate division TM6 bacterium GW2011_GWE2_31_21]KKP53481.1 MAG: hypothetical protein UR43_C0004G0022 [candidate division TM6 bacterium GW2011_GWF2_33_332]HBS48277.1 hypothetical protein [Candidatus Dependentiae bacterium]HBZ73704.1 hypothetical protein [Candidatus Dependentiae bacterium]